jgi:hypothetical protein
LQPLEEEQMVLLSHKASMERTMKDYESTREALLQVAKEEVSKPRKVRVC